MKAKKQPVLYFRWIGPHYLEGSIVTAKITPCGLVEARANKSQCATYYSSAPGLGDPLVWKPITLSAYTKLNLLLKAGTYVHGK